jgi:hypothetical protein
VPARDPATSRSSCGIEQGDTRAQPLFAFLQEWLIRQLHDLAQKAQPLEYGRVSEPLSICKEVRPIVFGDEFREHVRTVPDAAPDTGIIEHFDDDAGLIREPDFRALDPFRSKTPFELLRCDIPDPDFCPSRVCSGVRTRCAVRTTTVWKICSVRPQ